MNVVVRVTLTDGFLAEGSTLTVVIDGLAEQPHPILELTPRPTWSTRVALAAETLGRLPWSLLIDALIRLRWWPHGLALTEGEPVAGQVLEVPVRR